MKNKILIICLSLSVLLFPAVIFAEDTAKKVVVLINSKDTDSANKIYSFNITENEIKNCPDKDKICEKLKDLSKLDVKTSEDKYDEYEDALNKYKDAMDLVEKDYNKQREELNQEDGNNDKLKELDNRKENELKELDKRHEPLIKEKHVAYNNSGVSLLEEIFSDDKVSKYSKDRFIVSKNDSIDVWVLYAGDEPKIDFNEVERDSEILKDLSSAISIIKERFIASVIPEERIKITPITKIMHKKWNLTKHRAILTIKASPKSSSDDSKANAQKDIITGSKEHLFLSADIRVTQASQLKYDSSTNSLKEKEQPTSFYIGINYMLGDLLSKDQPLYDYLLLKILLKASERPHDSFGIAVGWRAPTMKILDISLESFSPFFGVIWSKEDKLQNGIVQSEKDYGGPSLIFGLSFNFDKASEWLKKK